MYRTDRLRTSAGTKTDADGDLFIKPCTKAEIAFYETANQLHPEFAHWMPRYIGNLELTGNTTDEMIHAAIPDIVEHADIPQAIKEEIQSHLDLEHRPTVVLPEPTPIHRSATVGATPDTPVEGGSEGGSWAPSAKSRKIDTDCAVVLQNASCHYVKPNIMDAKLGLRLWADDAPEEKRKRFDEIANETTHKKYGFRVAGMRVYKGSEDPSELDEEGYRIYDKWWGRNTVNNDNILDRLKQFIFNRAAGIDNELGKFIAGRFAEDLRKVQAVLEANETRMYSSSLLFVFEGDGDALRIAKEKYLEREQEKEKEKESTPASVTEKASATAALGYANHRVDSGIGMGNGASKKGQNVVVDLGNDEYDSDMSFDSDEEEFIENPLYSLSLIDFAHAEFVPGQGPDENLLMGVRGLAGIFEKMAV